MAGSEEREVVYKIIYIGEPVTIALPPEEKAEVAHESGARIVVPAGAVAEETTVSVAEVEPPPGSAGGGPGLRFLSWRR